MVHPREAIRIGTLRRVFEQAGWGLEGPMRYFVELDVSELGVGYDVTVPDTAGLHLGYRPDSCGRRVFEQAGGGLEGPMRYFVELDVSELGVGYDVTVPDTAGLHLGYRPDSCGNTL